MTGFFTFGTVSFFVVAYTIAFEGRAYSRTLGPDVARTYTTCGAWTAAIWLVYPIIWGVCEGGNVISSDSEAIAYGILDLLAKR